MICAARTPQEKEVMWRFLKERGVTLPISNDFEAICRLRADGSIIGVIGYTNFCGRTCQMHAAGEAGWMSREFIRRMFAYPFEQMGFVMVLATVASSNARALRLDRHLGFEDFVRIKDGWADGDDMLVLAMPRNACRWIKEERMAA